MNRVWIAIVLLAVPVLGQWTNAPAPDGGGTSQPGVPVDTAAQLRLAISNEATLRIGADAALSNLVSGVITNVFIDGVQGSVTGRQAYGNSTGGGGGSSTNVSFDNFNRNGGVGLASNTVYRGDYGAAASNKAATALALAQAAATGMPLYVESDPIAGAMGLDAVLENGSTASIAGGVDLTVGTDIAFNVTNGSFTINAGNMYFNPYEGSNISVSNLNASGNFSGDGSNVSNVNAASLGGVVGSNYVRGVVINGTTNRPDPNGLAQLGTISGGAGGGGITSRYIFAAADQWGTDETALCPIAYATNANGSIAIRPMDDTAQEIIGKLTFFTPSDYVVGASRFLWQGYATAPGNAYLIVRTRQDGLAAWSVFTNIGPFAVTGTVAGISSHTFNTNFGWVAGKYTEVEIFRDVNTVDTTGDVNFVSGGFEVYEQ